MLCLKGTYDQLNLGGCACLEEASRRVQGYVGAYSDMDHVSVQDSKYFVASPSVGDAAVPSLQRHVSRRTKEDRESDSERRRWFFPFNQGADKGSGGGNKFRRRGCSGGLARTQATDTTVQQSAGAHLSPTTRMCRVRFDVLSPSRSRLEADRRRAAVHKYGGERYGRLTRQWVCMTEFQLLGLPCSWMESVRCNGGFSRYLFLDPPVAKLVRQH